MTKSPIFAHFDESIVGSSSIRAYGKQEEFIAKCDRLVDESQRAYYLVQCAQRSIFLLIFQIRLLKTVTKICLKLYHISTENLKVHFVYDQGIVDVIFISRKHLYLCRWLGIIMEVIGSSIVVSVAIFSTLQRDTLSTGLAGVSITYALQVAFCYILYEPLHKLIVESRPAIVPGYVIVKLVMNILNVANDHIYK